MKRPLTPIALLTLAALLTACGVPREAATYARTHAALTPPEDDATLRTALADQADAWTHLAALLLQSEPGGIRDVDPKFTELVLRTAALARRQRDLIAQNEDSPATNRQTFQQLQTLWKSATTYLNP